MTSSHHASVLGLVLLVGTGAPSRSPLHRAVRATDGGAPPPSSIPACIAVATSSRYVPGGYNHVVILANGCSRPAACNVATDVNPQSQPVDVAARTTAEVTTFIGSPASAFTARVACKLR